MKTSGHYTVHRAFSPPQIVTIQCAHCNFFVRPRDYREWYDRSGMPRYNKARAVMVRHLHEKHRAKLVEVS